MYNFTNLKSSVPEDHNSNHLVSPYSVITEQLAISRTSTKYNSTNLKSSVSWETLNMTVKSSLPKYYR